LVEQVMDTSVGWLLAGALATGLYLSLSAMQTTLAARHFARSDQ
jgi:hypothetical protein